MIPPGFHVLHEDVHHEVLGQTFSAEVLEQEAHVTEMKVGDASALGGHREAKILIEPLGGLEVLGRDERLDFSDAEIRHCGSLRGLTFEVRRDQRQDARPGPVKMYRVPPARAWWPAVGPRLDRRVRPHW